MSKNYAVELLLLWPLRLLCRGQRTSMPQVSPKPQAALTDCTTFDSMRKKIGAAQPKRTLVLPAQRSGITFCSEQDGGAFRFRLDQPASRSSCVGQKGAHPIEINRLSRNPSFAPAHGLNGPTSRPVPLHRSGRIRYPQPLLFRRFCTGIGAKCWEIQRQRVGAAARGGKLAAAVGWGRLSQVPETGSPPREPRPVRGDPDLGHPARCHVSI